MTTSQHLEPATDEPGRRWLMPAGRIRDVRTPLWKRITALLTLGSMVILGGVALAAMITLTVLMLVFLIERAIA